MQIIKRDADTNWVEAIIDNRWVLAKVYNEPSDYGINSGRVSKLAISKTSNRDPQKPYFPQICYNYDRGLDFDRTPKGLVDSVVSQLEALPLLEITDD